jgi:hypothetical protein
MRRQELADSAAWFGSALGNALGTVALRGLEIFNLVKRSVASAFAAIKNAVTAVFKYAAGKFRFLSWRK